MEHVKEHLCFEAQLKRLKQITGRHTQVGLAELLGVRQSSIANALQCERIPARWLVFLTRFKRVNPEWILTGKEPAVFLVPEEASELAAETMAETDEETLRRLPLRMLLDEVGRRIASLERRGC